MATAAEVLPGDVVVVPFPYTDLSAAKQRPALVLSRHDFNRAGSDMIVCAMTSNLAQAPASLVVSPDDLQTGRLPAPSRVRVGKVAMLSQSLIKVRVGQLRPEVFRQVMREFETLFP